VSDEPIFGEPLHVGRPNIGDQQRFHDYVDQLFERRWLSNDGPLVREFESRLAERAGVAHAIATSNGTVALELLLAALELDGEVIVPSFTFVATVHALTRNGLTPVFADIDPDTHALDPRAVEAAITDRTCAILPVHLWGIPAHIESYERIAAHHDLELIFDAAHAFSSSSGSRSVGSFGRAEIFSFHATKFFNTFEGGAITTDDDRLAQTLRLSRNFGFTGEDSVVTVGTNAKMPEICAAMGLVNLESVADFVEVNRRNYESYARELSGLEGIDLHELRLAGCTTNYQYVVTRVANGRRDEVLAALRREGVLARRYFWPGVHEMEPYRTRQPLAGAQLPVTTRIASEVLVLPTGTSVTASDIAAVCEIIKAALHVPR
jgi:dTDP-4-amino-4,6-dideoxygalactose transaminase